MPNITINHAITYTNTGSLSGIPGIGIQGATLNNTQQQRRRAFVTETKGERQRTCKTATGDLAWSQEVKF